MFCPKCHDEFRSGFTRCGRCNVDLVRDLAQVQREEPEAPPVQALLKMAEFCGFLSLDEAREAREQLRQIKVHSEILIRETPVDGQPTRLEEEYWIRADASRARDVEAVLGASASALPAAAAGPDDGFECGDCGHHVADEEKFCPNCGASFEDD